MSRLFALGLTGLFVFAHSAPAQLIAYEGFAYTPSTSLGGQNGGSGFAAGWTLVSGTATIQSGSLVAAAPSDTLAETGNNVSLSPIDDTVIGDARRNLATPIAGTAGTSAWVSVVIKGNGSSGDSAQAALYVSDGAGGGFTITTGASGGGINPPANSRWSIGDQTGFSEASSNVSDLLQSLLVARITFGAANDAVDLFVNPTPGGSLPPPDSSLSLPHTATLSQIELVHASLAGASASVPFDEIRLGRTFADVTPTAVPEPSTLLLTAAGLGLAFRCRRVGRKA
jgi:hypothetical protein